MMKRIFGLLFPLELPITDVPRPNISLIAAPVAAAMNSLLLILSSKGKPLFMWFQRKNQWLLGCRSKSPFSLQHADCPKYNVCLER
jgi:hypothetical protein